MAEHHRPLSESLYHSAPSSRQAAKFVTATTIGGSLLVLSGLILTGTVLGLILVTPLLVLFSPVLVPAAIVLFLVTAGFLFSGSCGAASVASLTWIYRYVSGKHPVGSNQLDYARMKLSDTAGAITGKAKEYGQYAQHKASEATFGS